MTVRRAPQLQRRGLHILLSGNRPQANRWLPWAKKKLHTLERYHVGFSGKSFGTMVYDVRQDVRVIIKCAKDQKWIIIEAGAPGLYMESGILDFVNTAPLNENTYLPAQLHYSTDIDAIRSPGAALGRLGFNEIAPLKLDGENRDEGDSKALGCKDKKKEITISYGEITRTFSAATPTYCPNLYFFKNVQDMLPPSMFSGKLRLLVQAIYGSKRRDYSIDPTLPSTTPLYLAHDGFTPWFSNNGSLFSAANYEYFALRMHTDGNIYARKLFPSTAGKKLRRYLRNNPGIPAARKYQYEAYLLSTLDFDDDVKRVKIGETGAYYQKGGPFGYGPAWNWKGDTGYVVTIRRKAGTTNVWQSTMLKISVSENTEAASLEDGKLSASVSIHEDTQDFTFRVNQDLIWEPDHLNSGMKLFVTQGDAFDGPTHIECDVPIKVVANYANDTFDVVRFKREDLDSTMGGFNANKSASNQVVGHSGCGDQGCDLWASATGAIEIGFYIENITGNKYEFFEAIGKDGDSVDFNSAEVIKLSLEDLGPLSAGISDDAPDECGERPPGAEGSSLRFVPATGGSLSGEGDFDRQGMLVVPYHDCDAVYIATSGNFDGDLSTATVRDGRATGGRLYYDGDNNQIGEMTNSAIRWASTTPTGPGDANSVAWMGGCDTGMQDCNIEQASGDVIIGDTRVEHFCNGAFTEAFSRNFVNDADFVDALYMPSCLGSTPFGDETGQGWEEGETGGDGWYQLFNPVVFPISEVGLPVLSKSTPNFKAFRATKVPGGGDVTIGDGSYDFDATTLDADKFAFSFVGFA